VTPELCFVSAVGDSVFMDELLEVVADAVRRAGGRARTVTGRYPDAGPDTVYVVVPHEYFAVTPEADRPSAEQCGRTIAFCVEHPGTATFERTASLLPELGAAVDINVDSTAELRARGSAVEHFQLGYSPLWDRWGGDPDHPRDVDVTYLGTAERRRSALLRDYAADLDHLRVRLLTPPHEPMGPARVDFLPGRAKHEHLAGSRLILNLHRERSTALEWVRVLEAICNGCVVVTETSVDVAPLVPGDHLVMARAESLGAVAAALAGQPDREHKLRTAAYEFVRSTLDMRESAQVLIGLATDLLARMSTPAPVLSAAPAEPETTGERPLAVDTPSWDPRFAGVRSLGREVSDADRAAATLAVAATVAARRDGVRQWQPTAAAALFDDRPRADVDVLVVRRPGEPDPDELLRDLAVGTTRPARVLVCHDGTPPGRGVGDERSLLHELPVGRGQSRNELLAESTADRLLVLDAGLRARPHLVERFVAAAADGAQVVHCPVGDPVDGLVGALPPEDRRLAELPYLGSGYLVSRSLVEEFAGWTDEPLLDGLEDHLFWRRVARSGVPTALVQQVLLHRTVADPAGRPLDLDPHRVWAKLAAVAVDS
jgi:hypothetical protein